MELSRVTTKRWVIDNVSSEAPYLAKRLAAKYEVRVSEVVFEALIELDSYLSEGGDIPDGWRTV